jgi:hypothetical protein
MTCTIDPPPIVLRLADLVAETQLPQAKVDQALELLNPLGPEAAAVWFALIDQAYRLGHVNVWQDRLAEKFETNIYVIDLALSRLARARLASTWYAPETATRATLSPWSAAFAGLKLTSTEAGELVSWRRIGTREPRPKLKRSKRARNATDLEIRLEQLADDRAMSPADIATAREQLDEPRRAPRIPDSILTEPPRPRILITGSASIWTEGEPPDHCTGHHREAPQRPFHAGPDSPPADKGRHRATNHENLNPGTICLRCDSWSLDWLLARIANFQAAATKPTTSKTFAQSHNKRAKQ